MTQFEYEETRQDLPRRKPIPKKETDPSDPSGRTSSSCTRSFMRADRDGRDLGFTSQTRRGCSCGQLPKPNRETTRFSHTKRETRKPPFFAPILPTPHVVCYSHCISSDSAPFFCVFSRRSAGPPAPDPVLAAAPAGKRNAKKSGAQTKRQGGEIRLSRKLYKGGTLDFFFFCWCEETTLAARKRTWCEGEGDRDERKPRL